MLLMNENNVLLVAVERCSLCGRSRKQFTCQKCIQSGSFNYSNSHAQNHASYAVTEKRTRVVCAVRNAALERLQPLLQVQAERKEKRGKVILLKNRIDTIRQAINSVKELNEEVKVSSAVKISKIEQKKKFVARLKEKTDKLKNSKRWQEKKENHERYELKLKEKQEELKKIRVNHLQALLNDIFPLSNRDVYPEFGTPPLGTYTSEIAIPDVVSEGTSSPESELEDATRTVHIGGRWISQSVQETECTILGVGMPASGDFIKYYEWMKSYRNERRNPELYSGLHSNHVLSIPASLLYTAQMCDVIAFFLDVNLPNRIEYSHFGSVHLPRQRLFRTINKLMDNVMHLCFSQMVPVTSLKSYQPIRNLQLCLASTNENLGRMGPFDTFEYGAMECPFDSDESAEELNYESTEEDSYNWEREEGWDQLMDLPNDPHAFHYDSSTMLSMDQSEARSLSSSASGLVTSAAASVASALWSWKR